MIEWLDEYELGIDEIDSQHKKFTEIIIKLNKAIQSAHPGKVLGEIFDELKAYSEYHFSTEEKYFEKFGYPKAEQHKSEHEYYFKKVSELNSSIIKDDIEKALVIMSFLEDWFINHITGSDKGYRSLFRENGL